jgi:predicted nucleotidyltransferase
LFNLPTPLCFAFGIGVSQKHLRNYQYLQRGFEMVKKSTLKAVTFMKDSLQQTGLNVQKIIVFGSQANGKYKADSDIDIIVISNDFTNKNIFKRARLTKDAEIMTIKKFMIPLDIVTMTPEELADNKSLLSDYARTGEVIFDSGN